MKKIMLFLIIVVSLEVKAQENQIVSVNNAALKIGDRVPDFAFANRVNFNHKQKRLSDFKGKLVILDFWATWCRACIQGIPEMNEFQEKFNGKVQVILVNEKEGRDKVERFISKREGTNFKVTLPLSYGDSLLSNHYFKGFDLPRVYWIDGNGILKGITSKTEVTEKSIALFLERNSVATPVSRGMQWLNDLKRDTTIQWQSGIYEPATSGGRIPIIVKGVKGSIIVVTERASILDLLRFAYGTVKYYPNDKSKFWIESFQDDFTLVDSNDGRNYGMSVSNYIQSDELYAYRLVAPANSTAEEIQRGVRRDLLNWFGVNGAIEKRKVKHLSLTCTDSTLIQYKGDEKKSKVYDVEMDINGYPLSAIFSTLEILHPQRFLPPFPLKDDTGYKGLIGHLKLDGVDLSDYRSFGKALERYGLRLQLVDSEIEMLVMRTNTKL